MLNFTHLFEKQTGGAVNIRGIQYQILYSILRSFELLGENPKYQHLTLEGIEDLDLKGITFENNFIQVKTADEQWNWAKLRPVLKNFNEIITHNSQNEVMNFFIIFNFSLSPNKPIGQLARFSSLSERDKKIIWNKFKEITAQDTISEQNALQILHNLAIITLKEEVVITQIKQKLTINFDIADEKLADTYLYNFVGTFLKWAKERKTVSASDINNLHILIQEGYSKQDNFEAVGQNLISKIDWNEDLKIQDYFEGKQTRAGHIASNLDVKRPKWLKRIEKEFSIQNNVCVILASSGQGKSTLALRYMYEYWDKQFVYHLRSASSETEANTIADYLVYLTDLQIPIKLFIDDIKEQTRSYNTILKRCSAKKIEILITVRNEDYKRFWQTNTTSYTIVEPSLDIEEAKDIFQNLKKQSPKSIHQSIRFPETAFEKLGNKPLLIEYMYLITQGQMLHEKLQDQINALRNTNKGHLIDILRYICLADSLEVNLTIDHLEKLMPNTSDLQGCLNELKQEYITIENENLKGLHWIRTKHLAVALHQDYNVYRTALKLLDIKPYEIVDLIVNTMAFEGVDRERFYSELAKKIKTEDLDFLVKILDALFVADENLFFSENLLIFEEVKEKQPHLVKLLPLMLGAINEDEAKKSIYDLFGNTKKGNINDKFDVIFSKLSKRSNYYTKKFASELIPILNIDFLKNNLKSIGSLLDWLSEAKILGKKIEIANWKTITNKLLEFDEIWNLNFDDFCFFLQGLYHYDETTYFEFNTKNQDEIIEIAKTYLVCNILIINNEGLKCSYVQYNEGEKLHDMTMSRIKKLHCIFPFCEKYNVYFDYEYWGLEKPIFDESYKDIPRKSYFYNTKVDKNARFGKIYDNYFKNNSYFIFQKNWYELRQESLSFVVEISKYFKSESSFNLKKLKAIEDKLRKLLHNDLKEVQSYEVIEKEKLNKDLEGCFNSYETFLGMLIKYLNQNEEENTRQLVQYNFSEFLEKLPHVQRYFSEIPRYDDFNFDELTAKENEIYPDFKLLLGYILDKPVFRDNMVQYLKQK